MTHASVFSGIGGPEVAAAMLGWQNLFHCEINPFGRKVLDYWFPNAESYEDITTTDFSKWRGRVDVLTGGFPCQPFSYAGKRRGTEDDRWLWPYMFRCIEQVRPAWVVAENVGGILTMVEPGEVFEMANQATLFDEEYSVHRYEYRQPFALEHICSDLEARGYAVAPILIPACGVGAPHRRDRVFFIARDKRNEGRGSGESGKEHGGGRSAEYTSSGRAETSDNALRTTEDERRGSANIGRESSATDSACGRKGTPRPSGESEKIGSKENQQQELRREETERNHRLSSVLRNPTYEVGERWRDFPSVSAIHRGNDGIPIRLDGLSLPFNKWKRESLKAYGNAIVPQVMYEIFRAIEIVEQREQR